MHKKKSLKMSYMGGALDTPGGACRAHKKSANATARVFLTSLSMLFGVSSRHEVQ